MLTLQRYIKIHHIAPINKARKISEPQECNAYLFNYQIVYNFSTIQELLRIDC